MDNERKSMPMVALRGMTILPEMVVHFDVSRERSIAAVQEAMTEEQKIFLAAQKSIETENPGKDDVYEVGTVATIKQIIKLPKHTVRVLVAGEERGILKEIESDEPYLRALVEIVNESDVEVPDNVNAQAMERGLKDMLVEYAAKNGKMSKEAVAGLLEIKGLKVSENQIDISVRFPVGESHYLVIRGIKPFTRIQLYGMDYRTDNRFETYNSSGYVYNSSTQTLYLKIRHKSETETVRLFYETEQPETSQPADATENASKQQNPENTGEAAPAQVSQGTENLDIPVQIQ